MIQDKINKILESQHFGYTFTIGNSKIIQYTGSDINNAFIKLFIKLTVLEKNLLYCFEYNKTSYIFVCNQEEQPVKYIESTLLNFIGKEQEDIKLFLLSIWTTFSEKDNSLKEKFATELFQELNLKDTFNCTQNEHHLDDVFNHLLLTASAYQDVAKVFHECKDYKNILLIAGLLHDIGKPATRQEAAKNLMQAPMEQFSMAAMTEQLKSGKPIKLSEELSELVIAAVAANMANKQEESIEDWSEKIAKQLLDTSEMKHSRFLAETGSSPTEDLS